LDEESRAYYTDYRRFGLDLKTGRRPAELNYLSAHVPQGQLKLSLLCLRIVLGNSHHRANANVHERPVQKRNPNSAHVQGTDHILPVDALIQFQRDLLSLSLVLDNLVRDSVGDFASRGALQALSLLFGPAKGRTCANLSHAKRSFKWLRSWGLRLGILSLLIRCPRSVCHNSDKDED
jgi:hypothetical protein